MTMKPSKMISFKVLQAVLFLAVILVEWREVLSLCPKPCVCMKKKLTTRCTKVKIVPYILDPKTKRLELANNQIKNIYDSLTHYHNLEYLDLSYNSIDSLSKSTFTVLERLQTMKLGWNMISKLENGTFSGLVSLKILELKGNLLTELRAFIFSALPALNVLDLSHNSIEDIHSDAFYGLADLKTLYLGHNKIKKIPYTSFPKIGNLLQLDMGHNPIQSVPSNAFAALSSLQKLSLNDCGLKTIPRSSFRGLVNLTHINIDENPFEKLPFQKLPPNVNSELPSLQKLYIGSGSMVETIKSDSFSKLKLLKELVIHSVPNLQEIEKLAFANFPNLEKISISFNSKLRTLDEGVFDSLNSLKRVNLRGNSLETLGAKLLPWDNLEYFDIRGNNFRCDCDLQWLRALLKTVKSRQNSSSVEQTPLDVECSQPSELKGRLVVDLDDSDFSCSLPANIQLAIVLVVTLVGVVIIVLFVLGIICRERLSNYVKNSWSGRKKGSRDVQYQKTSNEDESIYKLPNEPIYKLPNEETIYWAATGSAKLTPVTEL